MSTPERLTFQELIRRLREDDSAIKGLCLSAMNGYEYECGRLNPDETGVDVVLQYSDLDPMDFGMLCEALRSRASLEKLHVIGGEIDRSFDETRIAAGIACLLIDANTSIVEIGLDSVNIGTAGAKKIGEALPKNATLRTLDILNGSIRSEWARALANGLCQNASIEKFKIGGPWLSDLTVLAFADALSRNKALKELNLSDTVIGPNGLASVAKSLRDNTTLECLQLLGSSVRIRSEEDKITVANSLYQLIQQNNSLQEINLDGVSHCIRDGSAEMLADAVRSNTCLKGLRLGNLSHLSAASATHFLTALSSNHTLQLLSRRVGPKKSIRKKINRLLSYNRIGPVTAKARKTGMCPAEWFEHSIPVCLIPLMLARLEEIGGDSGTSVLFHFVREHKSILALIKSCAEQKRRKRKAVAMTQSLG